MDLSDKMSDKMSSVSNSSKFSVSSQIVNKKQDCQIAAMRLAMIAAGLDPDALLSDPNPDLDLVGEEEMEVDGAKSKKRSPSGSPDGKAWDSINSGSVSD